MNYYRIISRPLRKYIPVDEAYFHSQLRHFVLFRTLQVLGALWFPGVFREKASFHPKRPVRDREPAAVIEE